jgi:hypothetical protein
MQVPGLFASATPPLPLPHTFSCNNVSRFRGDVCDHSHCTVATPTLMPVYTRQLLYSNLVGLTWNIYLSLLNRGKNVVENIKNSEPVGSLGQISSHAFAG